MTQGHEMGWIRKHLFSRDHKVIGIQYLFLGLLFTVVGGVFAILIRAKLAFPDQSIPLLGGMLWGSKDGIMPPEFYNMLFTYHGSLMVFFAITPIVIGAFGNYVVPLQIGARDMAFPTLNMLSFWTLFAAAALIVASLCVPGGGAAAGWTVYAPLSSNAQVTPGWGQTLWILGIAVGGVSSMMGAVNIIVTMLNMRCRGMTLLRVPLVSWGLFYTSVLNLLWIPVVAVALFMIVLDRVAGTMFFIAGPLAPREGGQVLLYQHLFWGFGHPEVYILILPAWGLVADLLSVFSRKPAFGYKATVCAMGVIVCMSQIVWGHHMFTSGMNPLLGHAFVLLTICISVPTAVFFFNWLGTLWKGAIHLTVPMQFALGIVFVFSIGGLTGLFNALQALDIYIHDTYFVVGHFHYTLAASVLFGAFAGIYYWFPKMFGKMMNSRLGTLHFLLTFLFLNGVFFTMMIVGLGGHPRRIANPSGYSYLGHFAPLNRMMYISALCLGLSQLLFFANFVVSLFWGKRAQDNPWKATSLEWATTSPPPHENFAKAPEVFRGPHEYSAPEAEAQGRDFLAQHETVNAI